MVPESDLVLQIPTTSAVAKTTAGSYTSTITEIIRHSDSTVGFTVAVDNRADLVFLPGQYVNILVPGTEATRSYSFSSGPEVESASFLVKITPGGLMSEYLSQRAQVGDTLELTGPMGSFFLRSGQRRALLLAGGTGLAPLLSILEKMRTESSTRPVHLVYGVRSDTDLVELDTLHDYAESLPQFTFDYCVSESRQHSTEQGLCHRLDRARSPRRRQRRRLPVRPAADGRSRTSALQGRIDHTHELLLRKVQQCGSTG